MSREQREMPVFVGDFPAMLIAKFYQHVLVVDCPLTTRIPNVSISVPEWIVNVMDCEWLQYLFELTNCVPNFNLGSKH
jgi:hypothetical protein